MPEIDVSDLGRQPAADPAGRGVSSKRRKGPVSKRTEPSEPRKRARKRGAGAQKTGGAAAKSRGKANSGVSKRAGKGQGSQDGEEASFEQQTQLEKQQQSNNPLPVGAEEASMGSQVLGAAQPGSKRPRAQQRKTQQKHREQSSQEGALNHALESEAGGTLQAAPQKQRKRHKKEDEQSTEKEARSRTKNNGRAPPDPQILLPSEIAQQDVREKPVFQPRKYQPIAATEGSAQGRRSRPTATYFLPRNATATQKTDATETSAEDAGAAASAGEVKESGGDRRS